MRTTGMSTARGLLLSFVMLCIQVPASATIILSFDSVTPQNVGDTFSVDLIAEITDGDSIVSYGLDVNFDAAILETVSATVSVPPFVGAIVDFATDGLISLTGFGFAPLSGTITLATLEFLVEAVGTTDLTVSIAGPLQGFGLPFPPGGTVAPDSVQTSTVTTTSAAAVPEPGTLALISPFLALWAFSSWRQRKKWST